jgi:MFS family permease
MQTTPDQKGTFPKWQIWYVFILLFVIYIFDYVDRFAIVAIFPFLKTDWGLSDAQCGLFVSALFWSMVVFVIPIGALVDRWSRKKSIALMAIIWSLATGAAAFTTNFIQMLITRCVVGVGEAAYAPGGTAIISAMFKPEKRSRMIGIFLAGAPLGQAIGIAIGGIIAVSLGWRSVLGLVAIPGFIIALLFFWVKDYKTIELVQSVKQQDTTAKVRMGTKDIVKELFARKSLILNNFAYAACCFVIVAWSTWLPAYFQRFQGMSIEQSGMMAAMVMIVSVIGFPISGYLTDLWWRKQPNARMLVPGIAVVLGAIAAFIALQLHGGLQIGIMALFGFLLGFPTAGAISVTQDCIHPGLRSTSYAINVILQHFLGSALGPLVVGVLSDAYGLDKALVLLPALLLAAGIVFFVGSLFYKKDAASVEQIEVCF